MPDYELPIEKFLVTKTQEHFPDFDLRQGTAYREMVIKPMTIFMQPYRDQVEVLKRNMSLQNFELMITEEMEEAAISENIRLTTSARVRENIENYVKYQRFPWEARE